jgi:hypothetical protein
MYIYIECMLAALPPRGQRLPRVSRESPVIDTAAARKIYVFFLEFAALFDPVFVLFELCFRLI